MERVRWLEVLPILRLGSAFRQALQPGKLVIALLAVVLVHLSGVALDAAWSDRNAAASSEGLRLGVDQGVYASMIDAQAMAFERFVAATIDLDFAGGEDGGALNWLRIMVYEIPKQSFTEYPWFSLLFGALVLGIYTLAGGVICRMSATQVCLGKLSSLPKAVRFVMKRWVWYVTTPVLPVVAAGFVALLLILAGLVLFNVPGLEVVGGLIYGLLLFAGFVIALISLVLIVSLFLLIPALSVEGTDGFDAVSRGFNYVMYKPWQLGGYLVGCAVYLAAVYVLLAGLSGLTLQATHGLIGVGAIAEAEPLVTRYEHAIDFRPAADPGESLSATHWLVSRWLALFGGVWVAVVFSTLCCLQTQVYVLMRRAADTTPIEECAADGEPERWSNPAEMVDPAAQAIAAAGPMGHPKPEGEPVSRDASDSSDEAGDADRAKD